MAQRGINKVIIVGNLGADPEVRYTQSSDAVATLSVATSETWKDKQTGEQREVTEWHRVVIWGKLAEIAGEYLRKGSKVYVEGKLKTRRWTDQQNVERYTTEIVVQGFDGVLQMLDGAQQGGQPQHGQYQQQTQQSTQQGGNQYNNASGANARQNTQQQAPLQPRPAQAPARQQSHDVPPNDGFPPDFDDDIPF